MKLPYWPALLLTLQPALVDTAHPLDSPQFMLEWGSYGTGNGQFLRAGAIAVGPQGNVYVADIFRPRVQVFTASGNFITKWGNAQQFCCVYGERADGIALDSDGLVYTVEHNRVQVFDSLGTYVREWGTASGSAPGQIKRGLGIAIDSRDFTYIVDFDNSRVSKFTRLGEFVSQWGTSGSGNGQFIYPTSVAIDQFDNIYVGDNHRVQMFRADSTFVRVVAQNVHPYGLAVDRYGHLYIPRYTYHVVDIFDTTGAFRYQWGGLGSLPGQFNGPIGVAFDPQGNIYITDGDNQRVQKFAGGTVSAPAPTAGSRLSIRVQGSPVGRGQRINLDISGHSDHVIGGGIYDAVGRKIADVSGKPGPDGRLVISRSRDDLALRTGVHFIRVHQAGESATAKIVILQ